MLAKWYMKVTRKIKTVTITEKKGKRKAHE